MGVLLGLFIGFWAGRAWQAAVALWADHAAQRRKERLLRRARWVAWRAALWPAAALLAAAAWGLALLAR